MDRHKKPMKEKKGQFKKKDTLCWYCKNACGNCSWSRSLKPVKGWTAIKTKLKIEGNEYTDSYKVLKCPEYIRGR